MKNLLKILAVFMFFYQSIQENAHTAVVTSISQTTAMGFSLLTPGTSGGTIRTNTSCATASGTAKRVGTNATFPCANGTFLVSGTNNTSGANRNRVTIVIPATTTISNGAITMNVALSLSTTASLLTRNLNLSGASGGAGTVSVPVYGTITVGSTQATGNYSGTYIFTACNNSITNC